MPCLPCDEYEEETLTEFERQEREEANARRELERKIEPRDWDEVN